MFDHIVHIQYSNGVTIRQRVLKRVMSTSTIHSNNVKNDVLRADRKLCLS